MLPDAWTSIEGLQIDDATQTASEVSVAAIAVNSEAPHVVTGAHTALLWGPAWMEGGE